MITVNLRPDLKRKRARQPLTGRSMERLRGLGSRVKDPLLLVAVAELGRRARLAGLRLPQHRARARARSSRSWSRPAPRTSGSRRSSREKRHQETDPRLAGGADRRHPHRGRRPLRLAPPAGRGDPALPAYTWLVDLGAAGTAPQRRRPAPRRPSRPRQAGRRTTVATPPPPPVQFEINGRTVDIQAYTRFLRQLEASPWITDVTPVSAQTVVEKERPVTAFTIRATFRQADSAYIRTVPLSQSVR